MRQFELLSRRPGNTGVNAVGSNPLALSSAELYSRLATGFPQA
ncbi:hypothetical protein [Streptomyces halobius]|nr:hypothetical protein [Streptomyces halobius]